MRPLIELCLFLFLVPHSKGQNWQVNVPRSIDATEGGEVLINCTYDCPDKCHEHGPALFWKLPQKSEFNIFDNDKNAFAFHPNQSFVVKHYRNKTKLVGDASEKNCSLLIINIQPYKTKLYLRIVGHKNNFSFTQNPVTINVQGSVAQPVTVSVDLSPIGTTAMPGRGKSVEMNMKFYIYICVPVTALLIIVGVILGVCHKHRSRSLIRDGSGYYANFSRSNSARREDSGRNQDHNKGLPETKVIDEPVYVNLEQPKSQVERHANHTENVYGNVDYFK